MSIKYYFRLESKVYYITEYSMKLESKSIQEMITEKSNIYEASGKYETTLESLIEYRNDFNKWCQELMNNKSMKIYYKKYFKHNDATIMTFKRCAGNIIKTINFEPILYKEFHFIENCNNGGLIIFDKQYENKVINTFGYDFSAFYPNLLAKTDLKMPIHQGKRMKIKHLKFDKLKYGIYRCIIKSTHPEFQKVFMFSKKNLYTHYSIEFANSYKEMYNITIDLIIDDKYNAIVWDENKLMKTSDIFYDWFTNLSGIKQQYPSNYLVKHMMSYLWGYLISYKKEYYNEEDFNDLDVSYLDSDDNTEYKLLKEKYYLDSSDPSIVHTTYEVIKATNTYKYPYARLKPFLVSYARKWIGDLLVSENIIDKVIRIQTDGICLKEAYDFTHLEYYPKPEDKTTGNILWTNVNKYEKV